MDPEDPYSDPDHFQNSIFSSFYLFRHILKISSKSVHKFLSYLVYKQIWQPGSTRSRQWSRSLPKTNHLFFVPFKTFPENFIKIHPWLFELFVFKIIFHGSRRSNSGPDHFQNWIISSFYHFFLLPFVTYPKTITKFILKFFCSLDPDDPDHSKNVITCSLYHLGHLMKMSSQSIHNFLKYLSLKITFHGSRRSI